MNKEKVIKNIIISFIFIIIVTILYVIVLDKKVFRSKEMLHRAKVSAIETSYIGVTLLENGKEVARRDYNETGWNETKQGLLIDLTGNIEGNNFIPGKIYEERLAVKNSGGINEYVRVSVYRYWTDAEGNKMTEISPSPIELKFVQDGWIIDEDATTAERTVLYCTKLIKVGESVEFSESFRISSSVSTDMDISVSKSGENTIINTKRAYDGYEFCLEVKVDAVQDHNAQDAILTAWGRKVIIASDGTLSLK